MIFRLCRFLLKRIIIPQSTENRNMHLQLKLYFKYQTESKIRTPFCLPKKKNLIYEADMHDIWWLLLEKGTKESNYTDDAQTFLHYYHWCACLLFALACTYVYLCTRCFQKILNQWPFTTWCACLSFSVLILEFVIYYLDLHKYITSNFFSLLSCIVVSYDFGWSRVL